MTDIDDFCGNCLGISQYTTYFFSTNVAYLFGFIFVFCSFPLKSFGEVPKTG